MVDSIQLISLLISLILSTNAQNVNYVGPSLCPANSKILGYVNLTTLNNDIEYISKQEQQKKSSKLSSHVLILCPSTVFLIESSPIQLKISNTTLQCGSLGSQSDKCIVEGGTTQLLFPSNVKVTNVEVRGLTFIRNTVANVEAYATFDSYASFYDCAFKANTGSAIFNILSKTGRRTTQRDRNLLASFSELSSSELSSSELSSSSDSSSERNLQGIASMKISIHSSLFQDNYLDQAVVVTKGGDLELHTTTFYRNTVGLFVVGAIDGAFLSLHYNTTFNNNFSPYYTVFTDTYSSLKLNHANFNNTNTAESSCSNGVYQQSLADDSIVSPNCFEKQSNCTGNCCRFGNVTCSDEIIITTTHTDASDNNPFTYSGPQECPYTKKVIGYRNLTTLIQDMFYDKAEADILAKNRQVDKTQEYKYLLCPLTIYNMDQTPAANLSNNAFTNAIIPLLDNTIIQCGNDGLSTDECILTGGRVQILFLKGFQVKNVHFKGLSFKSNAKMNVAAWSTFHSSGNFHDCSFRSNSGRILIHMTEDGEENDAVHGNENNDGSRRNLIQDELLGGDSTRAKFLSKLLEKTQANNRERQLLLPTSSMRISMYSCEFRDNYAGHSLIYDHGGILQLFDTIFSQNNVAVYAVGALYGANLYLHSGTSFQYTTSTSFTIYIDETSFLKLNKVQTVSSQGKNAAPICSNGIFLETLNELDTDSNCLVKDAACHGACCPFGNSSSCLGFAYDPAATASSGTNIGFPDTSDEEAFSSSQDSDDKKCGPSCISASVLAPFFFVVLFICGCFYIQEENQKIEEYIGEDATPTEHQII